MKMMIVLAALAAVALAAPERLQQSPVSVVRETLHDNAGLPQPYAYDFELSDGQTKQEQGQFKDGVDAEGKPIPILSVTGSYSYTGPDGHNYVVNYVADETGFHASNAQASA